MTQEKLQKQCGHYCIAIEQRPTMHLTSSGFGGSTQSQAIILPFSSKQAQYLVSSS